MKAPDDTKESAEKEGRRMLKSAGMGIVTELGTYCAVFGAALWISGEIKSGIAILAIGLAMALSPLLLSFFRK